MTGEEATVRVGKWVRGRDPGVQPERTRLAWRRTTLTFLLVVVLAGREVVVTDRGAGVAVVGVACQALLWVAFLVMAHRRIRQLAHGRRPPPVARATMVGAAGVIVLGAALAVLLLAAGA